MTCAGAFAQEDEEPKLVVKPTGRILMDAGIMHSTDETLNDQLNDGAAIPDVRIGVGATYGKWKAKVDIGYARQSLSLKDISLDYNFNKENLIRMGYFVHQFGLQSGTSSSFKISMEEPLANQAFFNSRLIGAMYVHAGEKFHATASVFAENDALKAAFGHKLSIEDWTKIAKVKDVYGDVLFTAPIVAVNVAHPLLQYMYDELNDKDRKFTFLCGHDSNIASVDAALGVEEYSLPNSIEKKTPIGSKLVLEKWVDAAGKAYVAVNLVYQSTDQLKQMSLLDMQHTPQIFSLKLKGLNQNTDGLYTFDDVNARFLQAICAYDDIK